MFKGKIIAQSCSIASKNEEKLLNISKVTLLSSSHDWSWSSSDPPADPWEGVTLRCAWGGKKQRMDWRLKLTVRLEKRVCGRRNMNGRRAGVYRRKQNMRSLTNSGFQRWHAHETYLRGCKRAGIRSQHAPFGLYLWSFPCCANVYWNLIMI